MEAGRRAGRHPAQPRRRRTLSGGWRGGLLLAGLGLGVAAADTELPARLEELVDRPWWRPRAPLHEPLPGTTGSTAAACGQCHIEIYAEWKASIHAHAWTDAQFQKELHKDPEVAWICINCHTPVAGQQEELVEWDPEQGVRAVDRRPNPEHDPVWQDEGITCMTCHWRPEGIAAPHADVQAPHPTVHAPELLEAELCTSCHQADVRLEDSLVCHFTTGQEWREELAASLGLQGDAEPPPCQSCHMEEVVRPVAPGFPPRVTRRHSWPGSLIPKDDAPPEELAQWAGWEPGVDLEIHLPAEAAPGQRVDAVVTVENDRAGHRVPTGDPERYLWLSVRVEDPSGAGLAGLQARMGQRWIWWPLAVKLDDDRVRPGEVRRFVVPFVLPEQGATVHARLEHYRISPENAAFHELEGYPTHRVVAEVSQPLAASVATPVPAR